MQNYLQSEQSDGKLVRAIALLALNAHPPRSDSINSTKTALSKRAIEILLVGVIIICPTSQMLWITSGRRGNRRFHAWIHTPHEFIRAEFFNKSGLTQKRFTPRF